jgi:glycosyltransferase involved in cell wall biosynthesis
MSTKAILFIHHANDMYGADIGLLHALKSLDRQEYHPIVILPSDTPTGMLAPELDRLGIEYHFARLGILRRKYLTLRSVIPLAMEVMRGVAFVRSTARKRQVVLVYINTFVTLSGAIGGKLAGVPVLWHVREILSMPRPLRWVLHNALRLCASHIVCVSKAVRDSLLKEAPKLAGKSVVIYNAVSVATNDGPEKTIGFRGELGVTESALLVGMVGRIQSWKGQEVLAEAAALVLRKQPEVHFVAVGSYFADESHYLQKLTSLLSTLGIESRFHLADYRSNVTDVYRALDVFVLPSIKPEPFGRVTVEAMTQGRAVIATNHGGSCELIQDGKTGMLVPPSDPRALAEAIELLLANSSLRERMGQAAATFAKATFGLPGHGQKIRNIINELVVTSPPKAQSLKARVLS